MLRISVDLMVLPHPLIVIQYARSSYYYNNVYVSCTSGHLYVKIMCKLCNKKLESFTNFIQNVYFTTMSHIMRKPIYIHKVLRFT